MNHRITKRNTPSIIGRVFKKLAKDPKRKTALIHHLIEMKDFHRSSNIYWFGNQGYKIPVGQTTKGIICMLIEQQLINNPSPW